MPHYDTIDLQVCSDCLLFIANGDAPADDNPSHPWVYDGPEDEGYHVHAGDTDRDAGFSWRRCDTCHSGLGGDRHHAVAMRRCCDGAPEEMIEAYIGCALWSTTHTPWDEDTDTEGDPVPMDELDAELSPALRAELREDCNGFLHLCEAEGIDPTADLSWAQVGHNLWLSGQGHGAGFWDRGIAEGDALHALSKNFTCDLYLGDDGLIHG